MRLSFEHRSNRKHIYWKESNLLACPKMQAKKILTSYAEYMDRYSYTWTYIRKIIQIEF